jgi:protein-S-isoprenylcysteine O-methyltransferase Ste14/pimeloyl-ACP methyl ester carboxylesterase
MATRPPRLARAILAFIALPGVVAFLVPLVLAWPIGGDGFRLSGLIPLVAGVCLLLWCVRDFYVAGKGTLAPWDPPRNLVSSGLYRRSRNPMYVAVGLVLIGWAIGFRSSGLWLYVVVVMVAFHLRVVFGEEPWLARTHRKEWERYTARVPRWLFPSRRALALTLAVLVILLPLAGFVYEAYADARTRREHPMPGMLVDVGGRQLHLLCIGEGSPIVLFEASGFGTTSLGAATVRERVSTRTRVCSYDRMGMGWSDAGPAVITAGALARDLALLQDRAALPAPFVLVASSVGGLTAEMFARQYPERTAGLIMLDAATSGLVKELALMVPAAGAGAAIVAGAARLGAVRLLDPFGIEGDTNEARRSRGFTYGARAIGTLAGIVRGREETAREFDAAPALRADLPIVVLSASDPRILGIPGLRGVSATRSDLRLQSHQAMAKASTSGVWRTVPNSEHLIAVSQPDAVIEAIVTMLDELR